MPSPPMSRALMIAPPITQPSALLATATGPGPITSALVSIDLETFAGQSVMQLLSDMRQDSSLIDLQGLFPLVGGNMYVDPPADWQMHAFYAEPLCVDLVLSCIGDDLLGRAAGPRIAISMHTTP